jgi:hypothetical protein
MPKTVAGTGVVITDFDSPPFTTSNPLLVIFSICIINLDIEEKDVEVTVCDEVATVVEYAIEGIGILMEDISDFTILRGATSCYLPMYTMRSRQDRF